MKLVLEDTHYVDDRVEIDEAYYPGQIIIDMFSYNDRIIISFEDVVLLRDYLDSIIKENS